MENKEKTAPDNDIKSDETIHGMGYKRDTTNLCIVVAVIIGVLLYYTNNPTYQFISVVIFFLAFLVALFAPRLLYPYL